MFGVATIADVTHASPRAVVGVAADDLLLKVTPPRVPRHQVARPRLQSDHERLRDHPLVLVQAPAGYGKTSLLAQAAGGASTGTRPHRGLVVLAATR